VKKITFIFFLLFTLFIAGCQNTGNSTNSIQEQNDVPDYTPSSEDIVEMHGEIENMERFKEFLNNIEQEQRDNIRVVRYTTEGDPMLHDVEYDGEVIKSTTDTRRDKFGEGSINTTTCTSIEVVETTERTDYILDDCENIKDDIILVIWK